jgi:hypothetical protein
VKYTRTSNKSQAARVGHTRRPVRTLDVFVSHNNNNNANMHDPCRCMSLRSTNVAHRNATFASPVIGADACMQPWSRSCIQHLRGSHDLRRFGAALLALDLWGRHLVELPGSA